MSMDCNCQFAQSLFKKCGYLAKKVRFLKVKTKSQQIIIQNLQRKLRKFEEKKSSQGHDQGQNQSKSVISKNENYINPGPDSNIRDNNDEIAPPEGNSDSTINYIPRRKRIRKEFVMNPAGKTAVSILHEYAQGVLGHRPTYQFDEIQSALTPYSATVKINGLEYGTGFGVSKKQAKLESAKVAVEILIPDMKGHFDNNSTYTSNKEKNDQDLDILFDQVELDDNRITEICSSLNEPLPYALLLTCLKRNFGKIAESQNVNFDIVSSAHKNNRFKMEAAGLSVEVQAPNKRDGKQLAAQVLLTKIHPEIKNFSSFLRLYGNRSVQTVQEKKQKELEITSLQSQGSFTLINKLKEEMSKLRSRTNNDSNNFVDLKNKNNTRVPGGNLSTNYTSMARNYDENVSQNEEQMTSQSSQDQNLSNFRNLIGT